MTSNASRIQVKGPIGLVRSYWCSRGTREIELAAISANGEEHDWLKEAVTQFGGLYWPILLALISKMIAWQLYPRGDDDVEVLVICSLI